MEKSKALQKIAEGLKDVNLESAKSSNSILRTLSMSYINWLLYRMKTSGLICSYSVIDAKEYYNTTGSRELLDNGILLEVSWSESSQSMYVYDLLLMDNGEVRERTPFSGNRKIEFREVVNNNIKGTLF